jgi:hypothetical protein
MVLIGYSNNLRVLRKEVKKLLSLEIRGNKLIKYDASLNIFCSTWKGTSFFVNS